MPIYEYVCEACGQEFEKMVRFSDVDSAPVCPVCGSKETHKQISRVAANTGSTSNGSSTNSCSGGSHFS